nr:putative ribonuclease h protein [Quercus suber]
MRKLETTSKTIHCRPIKLANSRIDSIEQQQHGLPGPSDNSVLALLWKKIWGLQVPNKVKHLAWKACKDSLPTKTNLIRRKIITEGCCDVCKLHQEDVVHALFLYPALQLVWRPRAQWNHSTLQACSSFTDIFELIFASNREPDLFAVVLWTLWNRRNNLRLGKPALSLSQVVKFAQDRLLERASCSVGIHQTRPHQVAAWQALVQDTYKVNFDGAIFVEEGLAGLGVVIRNDHGLISYRGGSLGSTESIGAYN